MCVFLLSQSVRHLLINQFSSHNYPSMWMGFSVPSCILGWESSSTTLLTGELLEAAYPRSPLFYPNISTSNRYQPNMEAAQNISLYGSNSFSRLFFALVLKLWVRSCIITVVPMSMISASLIASSVKIWQDIENIVYTCLDMGLSVIEATSSKALYHWFFFIPPGSFREIKAMGCNRPIFVSQ